MESAGAQVGRLPVARKNSSMDLRAFMAKKMVASLICKKSHSKFNRIAGVPSA
jgi:hypothetical protein